jgi:ribokinase
MTVLVVGNCTVDLIFRLARFPGPGETLLARDRLMDLGGKGANQAVVSGRFGADTRLVAPLGRDPDGRFARSRLEAEAVDLSGLLEVDAPTDQSVIYVRDDGENCIVSSHAAAASVSPEQAVAALAGSGPGDLLLVQGNLGFETTRAVLEAARRFGMGTMVNPAPIHWNFTPLWPVTDTLVLNRVELAALAGTADPVAGSVALRTAGVGTVVVTLGGDGAVLVDGEGAVHRPAHAVAAVDTAGAGDTFCGALAAAVQRGGRPRAALDLAMRAAALTVGRPGTGASFPLPAEAAALWAAAGLHGA